MIRQHKIPCQHGPLGTWPQWQQVERAMFLSGNGNTRWVFQASIGRALLSYRSTSGALESSKRTPAIPAKRHLAVWNSSHDPELENLHGLMRPPLNSSDIS